MDLVSFMRYRGAVTAHLLIEAYGVVFFVQKNEFDNWCHILAAAKAFVKRFAGISSLQDAVGMNHRPPRRVPVRKPSFD